MSRIVIAGGGPTGQIAALALAAQGHTVALADPQALAAKRDTRSTAFLAPSVAFLDSLGLWAELAPLAVPLEALTLIDATGTPPRERSRQTFAASAHGMAAFAQNIANDRLRDALSAKLSALANVTVHAQPVRGLFTRTSTAEVTLGDGTRLSADLVLAADGRNSALRQLAGIPVIRRASGQIALAFAVTHPVPHGQVSTEIYTQGGPCTLVPLPDIDGKPASAVVWMDEASAQTARLTGDLDQAVTTRTLGLFGPLTRVSPIGQWKIETLVARSLSAERLVLLGEAAHVLPPIGAQGLNTTIGDIRALTELLAQSGDIGAPDRLARYNRARAPDIAVRAAAIAMLNGVTSSSSPWLLALRKMGLGIAGRPGPLRETLVRVGLG